jgi:bifunctional non-homologous end joining protein LigD
VSAGPSATSTIWREGQPPVAPMLASTSEVPLVQPEFVYEPKYDGIRTIAYVSPGRPVPEVRLYSRLGNDKTAQFPAVAKALARYALKLKQRVVLDGEIVALDDRQRPTGFQNLQGRLHLKSVEKTDDSPTAFIAFDVIADGPHDLRNMTLVARRAALERIFGNAGSPLLRISEQVAGDGRDLYRQAIDEGWEGLIAKRSSSKYVSGKRTPDWAKLKLVREQEFVVGGWTEPRGTRNGFGALLLGVYEHKKLVYVAHVGSGFDHKELARVMAELERLRTTKSSFDVPPPTTNETPHWVKPKLVAQVKFTEWTDDNKLRHPTYVGMRDDKKPEDVVREETPQYKESVLQRLPDVKAPTTKKAAEGVRRARLHPGRTQAAPVAAPTKALQLVVDQLQDLEDRRKRGVIALPDGDSLEVGNLEKVFWPDLPATKGDLLRYYVRVSPCILPVVADRALVMKRHPNGVGDEAFYQHRAPDKVPAGVRTVTLPDDDVPSRLVGGSLKTLLYLAQLAAISMDPWFSRVETPHIADHVAFDLDPMPGTPFEHVLDVARWLHDELEKLNAVSFPKTSGADGLHVYVPLPKRTPYESGRIWAQIIATMVAAKHPKVATVERTVRKRGAKIYVDYLQNIEGKTLACAYSARASAYGGASTPMTWKEVHAGFDRRDFTMATLPGRIAEVGDLWKGLPKARPPKLEEIAKRLT